MSPTTGDGLISMEDGAAAGRQTALATLATLRRELGSLDKVKCLVKTLGLVNATTDFENHVAVVNVSTAVGYVYSYCHALSSTVIVPWAVICPAAPMPMVRSLGMAFAQADSVTVRACRASRI